MGGLDEILDLTEQVEACLEAGDWSGAAEFNERRQQLLSAMFAERRPGEIDAETREVLRDILARNETAAARVRLEQELVATTQRRIHRSAAAVDAYRRAAVDAA